MARKHATVANPTAPRPCPPGEPFLRTRFTLPTRPATFVRRQRLVAHLDHALTTPLTLVNGTAGAGKTLATADWAAGLREPVAWLTLEADDRQPGTFWAYVFEALRTCAARTSRTGENRAVGAVGPGSLTSLAADLNARDRPVVLVLDAYDRLTEPEVGRQLEFVLRHAGQGLRLVLVTRGEPALPLHRYRAAGRVTEIHDAELSFTTAEARSLLRLHGLCLPEAAVRALVERTRGWAAGLRLSALAAQGSRDPERCLKEFEADHGAVADFLLAEVFEGRTEETQDLLLRVSVLDRFCPGLADALTLRRDAEPLLAALHRENAFIERLEHSWYRLHPLFREVLRAHLHARMPGLEPELHLRAARWLHRSGFLLETLAHGAAGGDWDLASGALVDDLAIGQIFTGPSSHTLAALFSGMGPEAESPASNLVRAAEALGRHRLDHGLTRLRRAEWQLSRAHDSPGQTAARMSCALLDALAARLTGCPARAERAAAAAAELREGLPVRLLDAHPELVALLRTHVGSTRVWEGRLDAARAVLVGVSSAPGRSATALPRAEARGHLALIDYLNGWIGRAERRALAAVSEAEGAGIGWLVLAAVAVERQELDRARVLLDKAARLPAQDHDPVSVAGRALAMSRLLLDNGEGEAAVETAEPAVPAETASPWVRSHAAVLRAAACLADGRTREVSRLLQGVCDGPPVCTVEAAAIQAAAGRSRAAVDALGSLRAEQHTGPVVTVGTALVQARAAQESGDTATARRLVARALLDARRERLRRPFRQAGEWLGPLLATSALHELADGWLLTGRPPGHGAPPRSVPGPAPLVPVELSERERDVVRRLALVMTTDEIAADLSVSVNTVKTHLKSAYRKLAVNRRNDAVHRARELGLL
ncbi:LuxR C-terminal-related transcriptional regulator [Streptomyces ardesiacus]|uniref:LuxR C-terminal-related transcriptional regulator n=1 Tax=Streptomyces TaxID=1883 RepID=UPI0004BEF08C|nr:MULTISPECIES: LuxR C-terminal-related transcriptional regulator [unclassified Streptomyces]KOU11802.1 LuxR family transcriptional regulator [Streptomyces sp. NRRL F-4711]KOX27404.1 LuxR family transcriptional regulator [Streptomyces sp. NRRL F-4707]